MTDTVSLAAPARGPRIIGVDLARAVAMFGMVIAHYVWQDHTGDPVDLIARANAGRAMPLFVMLGGLGVTIMTTRSDNPDRALLIRAAMLFPLGIAIEEADTLIAVILQAYSLLFVFAVLLRRLPTWALLVAAVVILAIGGWTYQDFAQTVAPWSEWRQVYSSPRTVLGSLIFRWPYPFFPTGAFFITGMILGRIDLRSTRVATLLASIGAGVWLVTLIATRLMIRIFDVDRQVFTSRTGRFEVTRLLDTTGHSQMYAWVISALGTSVAILGVSLLIAPHLGVVAKPFIALGQLALTFYVFQAILIIYTPRPDTTPYGQELLTAAVIYLGFMLFATLWRMRFRLGPLEAILRLGSRSKRRPREEHAFVAAA